jgi:hypothetical protein
MKCIVGLIALVLVPVSISAQQSDSKTSGKSDDWGCDGPQFQGYRDLCKKMQQEGKNVQSAIDKVKQLRKDVEDQKKCRSSNNEDEEIDCGTRVAQDVNAHINKNDVSKDVADKTLDLMGQLAHQQKAGLDAIQKTVEKTIQNDSTPTFNPENHQLVEPTKGPVESQPLTFQQQLQKQEEKTGAATAKAFVDADQQEAQAEKDRLATQAAAERKAAADAAAAAQAESDRLATQAAAERKAAADAAAAAQAESNRLAAQAAADRAAAAARAAQAENARLAVARQAAAQKAAVAANHDQTRPTTASGGKTTNSKGTSYWECRAAGWMNGRQVWLQSTNAYISSLAAPHTIVPSENSIKVQEVFREWLGNHLPSFDPSRGSPAYIECHGYDKVEDALLDANINPGSPWQALDWPPAKR